MRAAHLIVASFTAAMLAAPAIADPRPPMQAQPPCPGAQPGEQVLSCSYMPYARSHRGAYDADPAAYYYPTYREAMEATEWRDDRRGEVRHDDRFDHAHSSESQDSGWREERSGGEWVEDRAPTDYPSDDR